MNENKVDLHLTGAQKNKFMKGLPFQMTSSQVSSKDGNIISVQYYQKKTIIIY